MKTFWPLLSIFTVIAAQKKISEVRYNWKYINYTWPSTEAYNEALKNGDYIPKNNMLIGVKVWKDKFYFALPRMRPGVPVVMATTSYQPIQGNKSPNLVPYPNWEMQDPNNCKTSLHNCQAMNIDPKGRMWVLNNGRFIYKNSTKICPSRLVVFDLENNDKILLDYEFPKDILDPNTGHLDDLVLDHSDGGYVYITNSDDVKPSIIVFSVKKMQSWHVTDDSMKVKAKDVNYTLKGEPIPFTKPGTVNGIALEFADLEENRAVYLTPLSSRKIYYIYTAYLKSMKNISNHVHVAHSTPGTHTTGMIINSNNDLYFAMMENNTVAVRHSLSTPSEGYYKPAYSDPMMQWMDTYAIDETGSMWVSVSRMPRVNADKIDLKKINYRLIKLDQKIYKNYQYYSNGSTPTLPILNNSM